ncbi:MAG: hypothetical protein IJB96_00080 [Lachnospira sp.]|nr:hypothetical protein [Lachnospira sp.]
MGSFNRVEFDKEIEGLLSKAEENIPNEILPDLPYMKSVSDVHEWYDFEHKLWDTGEEIRQVVFSSKKAFSNNQIDRILNICLDVRAKRGRQSFVMLLGQTKYCDYSSVLIPLLQDEDVNGHVIDTLYKMRANSYVALVTPFLDHKQTWIRNTAKKYVLKFTDSDYTG